MPEKAGIPYIFLDSRLRGNDDHEELSCFVVSLSFMAVRRNDGHPAKR
jgi:hypothetical protein